jgi:hypothetical protein
MEGLAWLVAQALLEAPFWWMVVPLLGTFHE